MNRDLRAACHRSIAEGSGRIVITSILAPKRKKPGDEWRCFLGTVRFLGMTESGKALLDARAEDVLRLLGEEKR